MRLKLSRRRFLVGLGSAAAAGVGAAWVANDPWDLRLERLTIELNRLPEAFDGFTIAHLTDLHHGGLVPLPFIQRAVDLANSTRPDLVLLTGDYIARRLHYVDACARAVSELVAPHGRLATLGNHDYWVDADGVTDSLTATGGCRVLRNEHVVLGRGGAQVAIAGLDDPVTRSDDLDAALSGISEGCPVILMSHGPDVAYRVAGRGVDLMLAGHTHGGQVVLPLIGPPVVPSHYGRRFASGLKRVSRTQVYVSRGVGLVTARVRINCPPEVTLITLRARPRPTVA
jgi:uncharacterized protein